MCNSRLHLSYPDRKLLKNLRIKPWECPKCKPPAPPKLRTEEPHDNTRTDDSAGRSE